MKKALFFALIIAAIIFSASLFSEEFTYVGAAKCKICHKTEKQGQQYPIWQAIKHSKSYTALTTEEAKALAANASANPECLECHAPLHAKAPELKEEGVTCEVCHGPGSAYKKLSIMKSREESVANGMKAYDSPEAIKTHCLTCHQNAHDKPFDFAAAWEKIKHPVPEKK